MLDMLPRLSAALAGRYVIERQIGSGGMATVYLARELKHDREVALKVLRPEIAAQLGAERFLNEVKITARLDHPHILTLIDSGESDGFLWYVQPYVRGESLRGRLAREKQLGIEEALAIARQVAGALEHAHHHGVIHRDIKPDNILLHEGEAMVADFGIALALSEAAGTRLTETGLSLGTPQYMSPEQATGERHLDARCDVYSLAAVLYEMLAGVAPHTGPTSQAVIAKLLTERPTRLRAVRSTVPLQVESAVARALEKTPADRFSNAAAFAAALHGYAPAYVAEPPSRRRRVALIGLAAVAVIAAVAYLLVRPATLNLAIGRSEQITAEPGLEIQPALSPDGRFIAYATGTVTQMRIFIRPLGGGRTIPVSDNTKGVEMQPRWSPDGTMLLFLTRGGAALAPALGGASRPVVPPSATSAVRAAVWSPDGREIAFVRSDSLLVSSNTAGTAARLIGRAEDLHSCNWASHGKWIACVSLNGESTSLGTAFGNLAPSAILLFPVRGGEPLRVAEPRWFNQSPVFSPDGLRLFFISNRDGPRDVYAVSLSSSGRPRGQPVRLSTGLGAISISMSADGRRLGYAVYTARSNIWSLPIPAGAPVTTAGATPVTRGNQVIEAMRVSRDGRWLLYDSDLRGNADAYRIPIGGGSAEQLTEDPADEFAPNLAPDGASIAYHSWRTGTRDIEVKPLNGGPIERVTNSPAQESYPVWSPDGKSLVFYDQVRPTRVLIAHRGPDGHWSAPAVLGSPGYRPDWSPDGRSIVYVNTNLEAEPGLVQVIPASGGPARLVFTPGAGVPRAGVALWAPDGRSCYFKTHDAQGRTSFWNVSAQGGRPRLLVRFDDPAWQSSRNDFATDGNKLYFAVEDRQSDVFVADLIKR